MSNSICLSTPENHKKLNCTKPPGLKETQRCDIQLIAFGLSSWLCALVAEKSLIKEDLVLNVK